MSKYNSKVSYNDVNAVMQSCHSTNYDISSFEYRMEEGKVVMLMSGGYTAEELAYCLCATQEAQIVWNEYLENLEKDAVKCAADNGFTFEPEMVPYLPQVCSDAIKEWKESDDSTLEGLTYCLVTYFNEYQCSGNGKNVYLA